VTNKLYKYKSKQLWQQKRQELQTLKKER
jgi:hypothetical protein